MDMKPVNCCTSQPLRTTLPQSENLPAGTPSAISPEAVTPRIQSRGTGLSRPLCYRSASPVFHSSQDLVTAPRKPDLHKREPTPDEDSTRSAIVVPEGLVSHEKSMSVEDYLTVLEKDLNSLPAMLESTREITFQRFDLYYAINLFRKAAPEPQRCLIAYLLYEYSCVFNEKVYGSDTARAIIHKPELISRDSLNISGDTLKGIIHLEPGQQTLNAITLKLNKRFENSRAVPNIDLNWAVKYGITYPDMILAWLKKYCDLNEFQTEAIYKLLCIPFDKINIEDVKDFRAALKQCPEFSEENFVLFYSLLAAVTEANFETLGKRPELLRVLESMICCYTSRNGHFCKVKPYVNKYVSILVRAGESELKDLQGKIDAAVNSGTDDTDCQQLFTQWRILIVKTEGAIKKYQDIPEYIGRESWASTWLQAQELFMERALSLIPAVNQLPGVGECRDNISAICINLLRKHQMPGLPDRNKLQALAKGKQTVTPFTIFGLFRTVDQLTVVKNCLDDFLETDLVVIATRTATEIARYIVGHRPLSLTALAEIGRHHPRVILPLLKEGRFNTKVAVPALVRFASAFEPLADAVLRGDYNQHLTPSWQGKLVAPHQALAERFWQDIARKAIQTRGTITREWEQALAHISQQKSVAEQLLRLPLVHDNVALLKAIALHHHSLIAQPFIDAFCKASNRSAESRGISQRSFDLFLSQRLVEIVCKHGVEQIVPLLPESIKKELGNTSRVIEKYPELMDSEEFTKHGPVALQWRDLAAQLASSEEMFTKLTDSQKENFVKRWPYLEVNHCDEKKLPLSFEQSSQLLANPGQWLATTATVVKDIATRFPSIAEKICFEPQYQPLLLKLTEKEQWEIWHCHENTADRALDERNDLDEGQICSLLRCLSGTRRNGLIRNCSVDMIARFYCSNYQSEAAIQVITAKSMDDRTLRNRLTASHWCDIACVHQEVAKLLCEPECSEIWQQLEPAHFYRLAMVHESFLRALLQRSAEVFCFTSLSSEQWLNLCELHVTCFSIIYKKLQQQPEDYQGNTIKPESLLEYRNSPLWEEILANVSGETLQYLLQKECTALPSAGYLFNSNTSYRADFYPFNHPLYTGMPKTGCCAGYSLDYIRFCRKGKNPSAYVYKHSSTVRKKYSALPYRVGYFQEIQSQLLKYNRDLINVANAGVIDLSSCLDELRKEKAIILTSEIHAAALVRHHGDLFYFEPNNGVWRWQNFDHNSQLSRQLSRQLSSTVANTLLKKSLGKNKIHWARVVNRLCVPGKRKATFASLNIPTKKSR